VPVFSEWILILGLDLSTDDARFQLRWKWIGPHIF
jgi:hypothetical protein